MTRRRRLTGYCHICDRYGPLSFEHVPPRSAFNNRRAIVVRGEAVIKLGPDQKPKGPVQQRGVGHCSLCEKCNNLTGRWYAKRFVNWCYQAMDILLRSGGKPSLFYLNHLFPLAILKQIVTMFLAVNPPTFGRKNPELVQFVLNRERKYLSPQYRFFTYYNIEAQPRYVGLAGLIDTSRGKVFLISEITYPPFGYLMAIDSGPPDNRLVEITHFSRYGYNDFEVCELRLPVLPVAVPWIPGDYRTEKEVTEQAAQSQEEMRNLQQQRPR